MTDLNQLELDLINAIGSAETAAAVEVEGRLGAETARATLDYLPAHGRETVFLTFPSDPRGAVELSVPGWSEP